MCCKIKNECDVCNRRKDKPQKLKFRWVGTVKKTITFSSSSTCVKETTLTSDSKSNEVELDATSCFGSGSKLPTDIYFKVDGSSRHLHASCSQALNLGSVIYKDDNKGFLILVGFRAMSGRTHSACSGAPPKNQCTCSDAKRCFTDVLHQMQRKKYRLECEPIKPKICEAVTHVRVFSDKCTAQGCSHPGGFKIDMCPCKNQCFDGKSCVSPTCHCKSMDCPAWSHKQSSPNYVEKDECVCSGATPCLSDFTRPDCDICNLRKDKPQKLTLRWVGLAGKQSSITFASDNTCVKATTLTSNSNSNEVVLDAASCFGSGSKLPTNLHLSVDGSSKYLHASCSQPLNVGDVVYKHTKGSLILVGFQSVSGRTESACAKPKYTCAPRSFTTAPSLSCGAGITLSKATSQKGVPLRINADGSVQYLWSKTRDGHLWKDQFQYTGVSCDGEKVTAKVLIYLRTPASTTKSLQHKTLPTGGSKPVSSPAGR